MKDFLETVVADLRAKRLLPVAILLIAGLVAVPVLLAKPADENAAAPAQPTSAGQNEATKALVALADEDSGASSTLKLFDPRDPFSPDGVKNLQTISSETLGKASTELASTGSSGGSPGGGSPDTGAGSTGGSSGGGEVPSGGGEVPSGGGGTGGGGTQVTTYTYVLDVTFTANGKTRKHSGMSKLTQLPSEDNPLLLFLGVDSTGDNAVFLVDSTLKSDGEGNCSPSTSDCATLSIGPGAVQHFTDDDGHSYTLRIDEIRKVKIGKASAGASLRAKSADADKSGDRESTDRQVRRFTPPLLADLVTVASRQANDSSTDKASR